MKTYTDTGRTAIMANGATERIYETCVDSGPFAGATYEVLESELQHPCKHGHFDCSDSERGPCSDEHRAVVTELPVCTHYTNDQLERMGGCPVCDK